MSNQIVITSGAKLRDLDDVIIGTDGILSSVAFNVANGVPRLDENGKILVSQLPNSVMEFKGVWNAATNSPTLVNGTGNAGDVWLCNVAGTVNFGAGPIAFAVGDYAVYTGTVWARSSGATGTVTSVGVSRDGNALNITGSPVTSSGTINLGFSGDNTQYINGAGNLTTFPTVINSIGLTMPAAFGVSNSPLTANGTIGVTALGYPSQYIRGDGTLADFPTSGGGGSSVSYYLNGGTSQGTIGGTTYYEMSKTADTGTGVDFNKTGDGFIVAFLTDANDPNLLQIPAGNWDFEIYASMSSNGGTPELYAELYKYDGTTFTLIATSSHEILYDGINLNLYSFATAVPQTTLTVTDRLAIKLYADNSGGKTTTIHTQDSHLCQVITTFSTGLTALNGLTAQVQYFGTGTSGSDFNIVSSVDTHTFNIPSASATARGLITTGTQTIAGAKTITGTTTFTGGPILSDTNLTYANSGFTLVLQSPTLSVNRTVTLPNGTGTLALISDLSGYVDLTTDQTIGGTKTFSNATKNNGGILLQNGSSYSATGYMNLGGMTNGLRFTSGLGISNYFALPSATGYTYTFPSATGTVALTSDLTGGTVTSVAMSVPTGLTVSGSPITTSGTLAVTLTAGYSIPTTANQTTWTTAYNRSLTSAAVTGTTTKTLTLNQQDGGTITASWTDINTDAVTSVFGRTGAVVATEGDYTLTQLGDVTITSPTTGQVLKYNGTAWINDTDANTGTVTSVAMTVPTGLSIAGSPITSSGTLAVTFAAGYSIPTNASQTTWDTAYTNRITSATGPLNITTNIISISQSSGSTNGYLSNTDWTIFNNKQSALTFTGPLVNTSGTVSISQSSGSTNGYLSSTDWTIFNNKQATITLTTTGTSGAATLVGATLNIPNYAPDLSGYVTLATTQTISGAKTFSTYSKFDGGIILKNNVSASLAGYVGLSAYSASGNKGINIDFDTYSCNLFFNGTLPYSYTFPNATGTLALTSDLGSYLPLAGGTLTGPLNGTSGTFSGILSSSGGDIRSTGTAADSVTAGPFISVRNASNAHQYLLQLNATYGLDFWTFGGTWNKKMSLDASGRLLVGGTITANGALIQTSGDIRADYSSSIYLQINGGADGDYRKGFSGINQQTGVARGLHIFNYDPDSNQGIKFYGGTFAARVRFGGFHNDGNFFINTTDTNDGYKFDCNGTGRFTNTLTVQNPSTWATVEIKGAGSTQGGQVDFYGSTTRYAVIAGEYESSTNGTLKLRTLKVGTLTDALTIASTGAATFSNLVYALSYQALNSNTSGYSVTTYANTGASGKSFDIGVGGSTSAQPNRFYIYDNGADALRFYIASTGAATFSSSVTASSFFESSDSRLKTLIQDNYQTKGIASITPKLYTKNGKVELGYYAQDFIGVLDNAILKGSDDMLSLSYREVHTAKIYALEQEIKELKAKLN